MRIMKATIKTEFADVRLGKIQKSTACTRNIRKSVNLRVAKSETQDQNRRPVPLPMATVPAMPAATMALTLAKSMKRGAAWEATEMPAMLFSERNRQSIQNCQVPSASLKE